MTMMLLAGFMKGPCCENGMGSNVSRRATLLRHRLRVFFEVTRQQPGSHDADGGEDAPRQERHLPGLTEVVQIAADEIANAAAEAHADGAEPDIQPQRARMGEVGDEDVEHRAADEVTEGVHAHPKQEDGETRRGAEQECAEGHHQRTGDEQLVADPMALQAAHEEILQEEGEDGAVGVKQPGARFRAGERFGKQREGDVDLHDDEPVAAHDGDEVQIGAVAQQTAQMRGVAFRLRRLFARVWEIAQRDEDVGEETAAGGDAHRVKADGEQGNGKQRAEGRGDAGEVVGNEIKLAALVRAGHGDGRRLKWRIKQRTAEAGEQQGEEKDRQRRRKAEHEKTGGADDEAGTEHRFQAVAIGEHPADEGQPLLADLPQGKRHTNCRRRHADIADKMHGNERDEQGKTSGGDSLINEQGKKLRAVTVGKELTQRRGEGGKGDVDVHKKSGCDGGRIVRQFAAGCTL